MSSSVSSSDRAHPADPLGWGDRLAAHFAPFATTHVPARIVRVDRGFADAATSPDEHRRIATASAEGPLAVGDWIALPIRHDDAVVLPRWSSLTRRSADRATTAQTLAANVDVVAITHDLSKPFNARRAERELVMAWDSGATPVIVLTKRDLCQQNLDEVIIEAEQAANGVDVLSVSATTREGIDALRARFTRSTVVFLGSSGAGKSSLVNALAGAELQDTGVICANDGRGRHTTTASQLRCLNHGIVVIDTPGIRAVGLWDDSGDGLEAVFSDVAELAQHCRFRDCQHRSEPGCAVRDTVDEERLSSYLKLRREIARVSDDRAGWEKAQANQANRRWAAEVTRSLRNRR
jgi:ribosome biogenesis GTPase / thiamine phosphate phosphatase